MDKLVSVIIPCYNGERFIDQSIASVYLQDYTPIELIVVDDGSTDGSAERIQAWKERFTQKGDTLKYLYQTNQGQAAATNYGLKHVTGQYLSLLDADDVFLPGSLSKRMEFLEAHPDYVGVRSNGWRVCGKDRQLFIISDEEKQIADLFTALSFGKTNNWAGTYMVRTSTLFEAYPDRNINPSRMGQNFQILLPVAYKRKFGYIDEPLMEYRILPESHSHAQDPETQYQKSIANSTGWRDIYRSVVNRFVLDQKERQYYLNGYDSVFYRAAMSRAIAFGKKQDVRENYRMLKKTGCVTLDDRITYIGTICPPAALGLRVVRKIKSLVSKK